MRARIGCAASRAARISAIRRTIASASPAAPRSLASTKIQSRVDRAMPVGKPQSPRPRRHGVRRHGRAPSPRPARPRSRGRRRRRSFATPPPIVPGMPQRNSSPAMPASAANNATFKCNAPAPATTSPSSTAKTGEAAAEADRDTGNTAVANQEIGAAAYHRDRKSDRQRSEEGGEIFDDRPAGTTSRPARRRRTRYAGRSAHSRSQPPAHRRKRSERHRSGSEERRAHPRRSSADAMRLESPGRLLAQPVIEPAPRHTTMSPGRASSATSGASSAGPASARTLRWPCVDQPGDERVARRRPRSAPRRRHRCRRRGPCRHR